jgi:hypothetical protein
LEAVSPAPSPAAVESVGCTTPRHGGFFPSSLNCILQFVWPYLVVAVEHSVSALALDMALMDGCECLFCG